MNPLVYLENNLILPVIDFFFGLTNNYVLAIVLMTIVIKMALLPFTIKQVRSMSDMKKIQPKIKELQKKYKDNPTQMQIQMMSLYKEYKVNPFGSCLPTIIQLPFFISIFMALNSERFSQIVQNVEKSQVTFLWINDLAGPDLTMVLPIIVAISTWLSQRTMSMSADSNDPTQKIFKFMPFFMLFVALKMPAGVLIYWALSQIITALQQYWLSSKNPEEKIPANLALDKVVDAKIVKDETNKEINESQETASKNNKKITKGSKGE
jgi:YidC/Oxa1 family membrane protein insertase